MNLVLIITTSVSDLCCSYNHFIDWKSFCHKLCLCNIISDTQPFIMNEIFVPRQTNHGKQFQKIYIFQMIYEIVIQ